MTGVFNARIEQLPDGYSFKTTKFNFTSDSLKYLFGEWRLTEAGDILSLDTVAAHSMYIPHAGSFNWLEDNSLLEIRKTNNFNGWLIRKGSLQGNTFWNYTIPPTLWRGYFSDLKQNSNGEIFLALKEYNYIDDGGKAQELLYKFDANGTVQWSLIRVLPDSFGVTTNLVAAMNGDCIYSNNIVNYNNKIKYYTIGKLSETGQTIWVDTADFYTNRLVEGPAGEIISYGEQYDSANVLQATFIEKRSAAGQLLWTQKLNLLLQKSFIYSKFAPVVTADGRILILGLSTDINAPFHDFFLCLDTDGHVLWLKYYSFLVTHDGDFAGAVATSDGGFLVAGRSNLPESRLFAIKIDADGNVFPGGLAGQVVLDENLNCLADSSEQGVEDWIIQLKNTDYALYASSDSSGHYAFDDIPAGDFELSIANISQLWETCSSLDTIAIPDTLSSPLQHDFPLQSSTDCPYMVLDVATPFLRRCFTARYTVQYCNDGTLAADSAFVEVSLDPLLHLQTASIPFTQTGNTIIFPVGQVQALECGQFYFDVMVDCALELGQSACVSAAIFPDSLCNPPFNWSGALLEGSGQCIGDSVLFQLHNIGTAPSSTGLQSYVVDEHVIMFQQPLPSIAPDARFDIIVPANGNIRRLISDQEPHAPGME